MICPHCKITWLNEDFLVEELVTWLCDGCGGRWIRRKDYDHWDKHSREKEQVLLCSEKQLPMLDSKSAKCCPDCRRILATYRVSHEETFRIDHCSSCNGVWFDQNEWEALAALGLQHQLPLICTDQWQRRVKDEETREHLENVYARNFGLESYHRLKEVRAWLEGQPRKASMLAFLSDPDPYGR